PLTRPEKARLTSGHDTWTSSAAPGVPSFRMADGPHGLRVHADRGDHLGLQGSLPATCFPPAVTLGSAWDPGLAERVGAAIAREAKAAGVDVVLGPGINIKRSPLCGRKLEYFSEDPLVAAEMGAALVRGLQGAGVGASLKHFAANNQETDRLRVSADIDERPLREIYLRAFERVVRRARPWTVMSSYNALNGVPVSENRWLLTEVLREEWGFDGVVVSDWGAVHDRVEALAAGLDLQMPSTQGRGRGRLARRGAVVAHPAPRGRGRGGRRPSGATGAGFPAAAGMAGAPSASRPEKTPAVVNDTAPTVRLRPAIAAADTASEATS